MKKYFFLFLCYCFIVIYVPAQASQIDNVVAIVNEKAILNSEVNQMLFLLKNTSQNILTSSNISFLKEKIIRRLILDRLMLDEAKKINLIVTDDQVNNAIKSIASERNITVNQLKNNIIFNNKINGYFNYYDYFSNVKKLLTIQMIQDYELHKRVRASDQEINFILKNMINYRLNHRRIKCGYIFFPSSTIRNNNSIHNKNILIAHIVKKLKQGYSFKKLCQRYKKNKNFLIQDVSWVNFSNIKKFFLNTLNIFKKRQILGPIKNENGVYIFKIYDIKDPQEDIIQEFHIKHCLIKSSKSSYELNTKKTIFDIYKNLINKTYSFDYAVQHFSQDVLSYQKNGDLGWVVNESFPENFKMVLLNLHDKEISKPIRSDFGWHIFQLLEKRKIDKFYKIKKNQAHKILLLRKIELERKRWIKDLIRAAYIKIVKNEQK